MPISWSVPREETSFTHSCHPQYIYIYICSLVLFCRHLLFLGVRQLAQDCRTVVAAQGALMLCVDSGFTDARALSYALMPVLANPFSYAAMGDTRPLRPPQAEDAVAITDRDV